jgi:hypothetical protein
LYTKEFDTKREHSETPYDVYEKVTEVEKILHRKTTQGESSHPKSK